MRSKADRDRIKKHIHTFKEAVEKLASLLSGKGVRVVFRGSECCTDGMTITLPALDVLEGSDVSEEEITDYIGALIGFVDHEVGHVVFSDMGMWKRAAKRHNRQITSLTNAIEDAFVERKMRELWRGCDASLERCHNYVIEEYKEHWAGLPAFGQITMLVCYLSKGHAYQHLIEIFDPDIVRWVNENLDEEISAVSEIEHTRQSLKLARAMYAKIKSAFQDPPPQKQKQGKKDDDNQEEEEENQQASPGDSDDNDDSADDNDSGKGQDDDREGDDDEDDEDSSNGAGTARDDEPTDEESGEDSGGEGDDDQEEDDIDDEEDDDDEDCGDSDSDDWDDDDSSDDSDGNADGDDDGDYDDEEEEEDSVAGSLADKDDGSVDDRKFEDPSRLEDKILEKFGEFYDRTPGSYSGAYAAYTTENDEIGPMDRETPGCWGWAPRIKVAHDIHENLARAEKLALKTVGPLKSALARVLKARGTAYAVRDLDHGALDRRRLWKVPISQRTGMPPKMFSKNIQAETHNVAILLSVNESGSMHQCDKGCTGVCLDPFHLTRMELARAATLALGDVLHALDIPFAIIGHTTSDPVVGGNRYSSASDEDQAKFSRFGDLKIEWIKGFDGFDATWLKQRALVGGLYPQMNTYDAEVLRYAARVLLRQRHVDRRILLQIDDGEPYPNVGAKASKHSDELRLAITEVTAAGLEVVSVGVASNSGEYYYPDHVYVQDIEKLPEMMLEKLGKLLGFQRRG